MIRRRKLVQRLKLNAFWSVAVIAVALFIGIVGYMWFGKMDAVSAFANAAMILSGMGPLDVSAMSSNGAKIFEGIYALVCGLLFFAVAGFALAPALHHLLRSFHLEDEDSKKSR